MALVGFLDDPRFEGHDQGGGHPESPARVVSIRRALEGSGLPLKRIPARPATQDELFLVHAPAYVEEARAACLGPGPAALGPDVVVGTGSWEAALLAAGSGIAAVQALLRGDCARAFCNLRPPGHHALRAQAMGFCVFNNVALAARWALERGGLGRVAILDWDVHHGNGTQEIFSGEPRLLYVSLHQHPFYPYTGAPGNRANLLNLPLERGSGGADALEAFRERAMPALRAFGPELLLVSCGFDAHAKDPLGGLAFDEETYAAMTLEACRLAQGRVVSLLEGGYDLNAIAASAVAHVRALIEA